MGLFRVSLSRKGELPGRFSQLSNLCVQISALFAPDFSLGKMSTPAEPTPAARAKAPPVPIGVTPRGTAALAPFQPSVASLALSLTPALSDPLLGLSSVLPLPAGLALTRSPEGGQLQLEVSSFFASQIRRIFGYVADISSTSGGGTETPAQLQIVTRIPWRYGRSAGEKESSWTLVRAQAFASKALFSSPERVAKLGQRIAGFAEP